MFSAITTKRVLIRQLRPHDAEPLFAYRSDPKVAQFQSWHCKSVEQCREFIDGLQDVNPDTPDTWFQLALVHRVSNELIGDCGLHFFASEPRQTEVGITLSPSHQRQGYATEALHAVLDYLFIKLSKHRMFASVDPRNSAAIALLERIGMRKEAHFIKSQWVKDEWVDDVILALLEREWSARARIAPVHTDV
jgi:RimJ/RimL family protein N-acetyltransferase